MDTIAATQEIERVYRQPATSSDEQLIGRQFRTRGKHPRLCTIIDVLRTYNSKGEFVKLRYVATHELLGQTITDSDVVPTTVAMGLL